MLQNGFGRGWGSDIGLHDKRQGRYDKASWNSLNNSRESQCLGQMRGVWEGLLAGLDEGRGRACLVVTPSHGLESQHGDSSIGKGAKSSPVLSLGRGFCKGSLARWIV